MRFSKEHLVDIPKLTLAEVPVFLDFLALERVLHMKNVEMCGAWIALWGSEFKRQLEEVENIDRGIEQVNKKFGLEEK